MRIIFFLVFLFTAPPLKAEVILLPARGVEDVRIRIASNTDAYAITPLIRGYQSDNPNVAVEYLDLQSNALFEAAMTSCETDEWFADLVVSSSMAHQFKLVNDGCANELNESVLKQQIQRLPEWAKWSEEIIGLTFEPAALVVNKNAFPQGGPSNHIELIDWLSNNPRAKGRLGTYDAAQSGVGKLFSFFDATNSESSIRLQVYIEESEAQYFCCSSQIIDLVADGILDVGYNVLGSYALFRAERDPRLQVIFLDDFTPVLTRAAYIPKTGSNSQTVANFLTYAYSPAGQNILGSGGHLMSSIGGETQLSELLDRPMNFLRPIPLSPTLLLVGDFAVIDK